MEELIEFGQQKTIPLINEAHVFERGDFVCYLCQTWDIYEIGVAIENKYRTRMAFFKLLCRRNRTNDVT